MRTAALPRSARWRDGACWAAAALLLAVLVLLALPARAAPGFPKFTGLVVDAANILPPDREAALTAKLQAFQQKTGRQLVVATIPDLQGYDIADYGYQLGRTWGVGLKDVNNGAILLVAPNERKVRIEVGYGLEPVLTDAYSSVILNTQILPRFKAGDMPGGIDAGADAIIAQLSLPDDQAKARLDAAVAAFDKTHRQGAGDGAPVSLVFWGIVALFILFSFIRNGGGGRRYRRGGLPVILWGPGLGGGWGGGSHGGSSSGGGWMGGGFSGGGGGSFGGGGASGGW